MLDFYSYLDKMFPTGMFWSNLLSYVAGTIQALGRKMAESSDFAKNAKKAKKAKKCILLVDPYGTH